MIVISFKLQSPALCEAFYFVGHYHNLTVKADEGMKFPTLIERFRLASVDLTALFGLSIPLRRLERLAKPMYIPLTMM